MGRDTKLPLDLRVAGIAWLLIGGLLVIAGFALWIAGFPSLGAAHASVGPGGQYLFFGLGAIGITAGVLALRGAPWSRALIAVVSLSFLFISANLFFLGGGSYGPGRLDLFGTLFHTALIAIAVISLYSVVVAIAPSRQGKRGRVA